MTVRKEGLKKHTVKVDRHCTPTQHKAKKTRNIGQDVGGRSRERGVEDFLIAFFTKLYLVFRKIGTYMLVVVVDHCVGNRQLVSSSRLSNWRSKVGAAAGAFLWTCKR